MYALTMETTASRPLARNNGLRVEQYRRRIEEEGKGARGKGIEEGRVGREVKRGEGREVREATRRKEWERGRGTKM